MVKVVQPTSPSRRTCDHCGAINEYAHHDTSIMTNDGDQYRYIQCAKCSTPLRVRDPVESNPELRKDSAWANSTPRNP